MLTLTNRRVTVSEIAHVAGVGGSAVSNWRVRYRDFPVPVEMLPSGDLFDLSSVLAWLELHGRTPHVSVPSVDRELWSIADRLRGVLMPDEAVLVVLQVLFVHRRAECFSQAPDDNPATVMWSELAAVHVARVREVWERLVTQLELEDPALKRVLTLPSGVTDAALWDVVERITSLPLDEIRWGTVTSAFLRRAQTSLAIRAGGLATPGSIVNLMIQLLAPLVGTVYDPAAGHAMVLAEAAQQKMLTTTRFIGQEVLESSWRIGYLHMAMQDADFELAAGDTIRDDRFRTLRADRIALEPPLGERFNPQEAFLDDRWRFGTTPSAEWMWAQHLLFHLAEDGIGVMTVLASALSRAGRDAHIRRGIISADLLDSVIELPPGLIPGTSAAVALLVFARGRANRSNKVLFIDARQLGIVRRGKAHELTMDDVERIAATVEAWRHGCLQDEPLFAAIAPSDAVLAGDAELTPRRFVRYFASSESIDISSSVERVDEAAANARTTLASVSDLANRVGESLVTLGPLPDAGWSAVKLKELLTAPVQNGTRQELNGAEATRPWIATRLVTGGNGRLTRLPEDETRGRVKGRSARRGDLLLASRGIDATSHVGCATVDFDGESAFAESLMLLSPDVERVHPDFLRLVLTSQSGRIALAAATTGTVIGNLRRDALEEVEVRLPDLATQRRIVEAMQPIEDAISHLASALGASSALFDALRDEIAVGHYSSTNKPKASRSSGRKAAASRKTRGIE